MTGLTTVMMAGLTMALAPTANAAESVKGPKGSLKDSVKFDPKKKTVTPLFGEGFKVMGIALKKGQALERHQTPTPAFLFVQSGTVQYIVGEQTTELESGDFLRISPKVDHEVRANEDSVLLLVK